jgi:hypothetical protein
MAGDSAVALALVTLIARSLEVSSGPVRQGLNDRFDTDTDTREDFL